MALWIGGRMRDRVTIGRLLGALGGAVGLGIVMILWMMIMFVDGVLALFAPEGQIVARRDGLAVVLGLSALALAGSVLAPRAPRVAALLLALPSALFLWFWGFEAESWPFLLAGALTGAGAALLVWPGARLTS